MPPKFGSTFGVGGVVQVTIDMDEVQGLLQSGHIHKKQVDDFLGAAGLTVANRVAEIARSRLAVGGKEGIGATGQAAANIFVEGTPLGAIVYEGSYKGNQFIRFGRGEGAKRPPSKAILDWMVSKPGFKFEQPESQSEKWRMTKRGGPRARSGAPRPFKRDLRQLAVIIANKIAEKGMTTLLGKYPQGSKRYDYYAEMFARTPGMEHFEKLWERNFGTFFTLYMRFLRNGIPMNMKGKILGGKGD